MEEYRDYLESLIEYQSEDVLHKMIDAIAKVESKGQHVHQIHIESTLFALLTKTLELQHDVNNNYYTLFGHPIVMAHGRAGFKFRIVTKEDVDNIAYLKWYHKHGRDTTLHS